MKTRKEEEVFSFILAPLIDVMLFILIFFMVSYSRQAGFQNISLPSSDTSLKNQEKTSILVLELNQKGEFFLEGKQYQESELEKELQNIKSQKSIILRADKSLSYQKVMQSIDLVKKSGLQKVYLATN